MNKHHDAIVAFMHEKDKNLLCNQFNMMIEILHKDGSHFSLHNALVDEQMFEGNALLLVWTEHCGYFYFFKEDLEHWIKYKQV